MTTRADWYSQHTGGGWRKARKPRRCDQALCLSTILSGARYFDTNQVTQWPKTKILCERCANEQLDKR